MHQYLWHALLLDHYDAVRTFVDDAHRDLLQIPLVIHSELREVRLGSTVNDTDNVPERADVGGGTRSGGNHFGIEYEVCPAHDAAIPPAFPLTPPRPPVEIV